jgi:hypothetical protein
VSYWDTATLNRSRQDFSINAICLPPVLPYSQLPTARRINQEHVVTPAAQQIMDVPSFPARLDCYGRGWLLRPQ